jgi:hypothetical protein
VTSLRTIPSGLAANCPLIVRSAWPPLVRSTTPRSVNAEAMAPPGVNAVGILKVAVPSATSGAPVEVTIEGSVGSPEAAGQQIGAVSGAEIRRMLGDQLRYFRTTQGTGGQY